MNSGLYSFSQIIEDVKQETGIENLRNQYPTIRLLIAQAEREINPYAGFFVNKKMVFHVGNGNFDGKKIKKPSDFVMMDKVGCCHDGICQGHYIENISHIIMCDKVERTKITFTYWGLQCDGDGNPITTYNHAAAVVAYIVFKLYSPKVFMGEGSQQLRREYKTEWENLCGYSSGSDFFPSMESLLKMRQLAGIHLSEYDKFFAQDYCKSCDCITSISDETTMENKLWFWQMPNVNEKIDDISEITDAFLATKEQITLQQAIGGYTFSFPYVGQIGFCIENVGPNSIEIFDLLNMSMNSSLFYFYDVTKRKVIFVSKEYKTTSSIFFKFNYNGQ
jgi:hypothetical protein